MATKKQLKMIAMADLANQIDNLQLTASVSPENQEEATDLFNEIAMRLIKGLRSPVAKFNKQQAKKQVRLDKRARRSAAREQRKLERDTKRMERLAAKEDRNRPDRGSLPEDEMVTSQLARA